MPYLMEHAARMKDPDQYKKIRRENNKFGKGIHAIWGVRADGTVELQAIRFDKSAFTPEAAKKWLKDHDHKPMMFEPAKKKETASNVEVHHAGNRYMRALALVTESAKPRKETLEGREWIVVPAVTIVEGVHKRRFYPDTVLENMANLWNGVPVVLQHPMSPIGNPISANSPKILDRFGIGRLFNVLWDGLKKALKAEVWIDVAKAREIAPDALAKIEAGEGMEVSTGLFTAEDGTPGIWENEEFDSTVLAGWPDHFALLPDTPGACSWNDGCGLNRNQEDGIMGDHGKEPETADKQDAGFLVSLGRAFRRLIEAPAEEAEGNQEALSFSDIEELVRQAIMALNIKGWNHYIRDLYPDSVVYVAYTSNPNVSDAPDQGQMYYRRSYSMDTETGTVTLGQDAEEVRRQVIYVPVEPEGEPANQEEEEPMGINKTAVVNTLIACTGTQFTEVDRQWLTALSDEQLAKIAPKAVVEPAPVIQPAQAPKTPTLEEYIAAAPESFRANLAQAMNAEKTRREKILVELKNNPRVNVADADLAVLSTDALEKLAVMAKGTVNYGGRTSGDGDQPPRFVPMPPVFDLSGKK